MLWVKYNGITPHILPSGRTLVPDEAPVEVNEKDAEIKPLLDDGRMTEVDPSEYEGVDEPTRKELVARADELGIEGAGKGNLRSRDSIRAAIAQREAELQQQETEQANKTNEEVS